MKLNIYIIRYLAIVFVTLCILASSGCAKEKAGTPVWLEIDTLTLNPQGTPFTSSSRFTDAWVYVNSNLVGGFELPARIPILAEGATNILVYPGIQVNGLTALRSPYLKIKRYDENIHLTPGETIHIEQSFKFDSLVAAHQPPLYFENFEGNPNMSLATGAYGSFGSYQTTESFQGTHCGILTHDGAENTITQSENANWIILPKGDVGGLFFEMNYKANTSFAISLLAKPADGGATQKIGVIGINPTDEWKKIYITLSPTVNSFTTGNQFKLAISYTRDLSIPIQKVYLDNLQFVY